MSFFNKQEDNNTVPCFPYAFAYNEGRLSVLTESGVDDSDTSLQWIINKVVPKLIKWMETAVKTKAGDSPSLRLVSVAQYSALYNQLKETYGKALVQVCLTLAVQYSMTFCHIPNGNEVSRLPTFAVCKELTALKVQFTNPSPYHRKFFHFFGQS